MKRKSLIICLGIFITILSLSLLTPLIADDFGYSFIIGTRTNIEGVSDLLKSIWIQYTTVNGRVLSHSIVQIMLLADKIIFSIINSVIFVVLLILISKLSSRKANPFSLIVSFALLFIFTPAFGENFLWLTGSINYSWMLISILTSLWICSDEIVLNKVNPILLIIVCFCGGYANENSSVAFIAMLIMFVLYKLIKQNILYKKIVAGIIAASFAYVLMLTAPGNGVRLAGFDSALSIITLFNRFINITMQIKYYFYHLIVIYIALLVLAYYRNKKEQCAISLIYFTGFALSNYSMILSPTFAKRTMLAGLVFLVIAILLLAFTLDFSKQLKTISISLLLLHTGFNYLEAFQDVAYTYMRVEQRESMIYNQINSGEKDITGLPSIYGNTRYNAKFELEDITTDSNFWVNIHMARYYNVDTIQSE